MSEFYPKNQKEFDAYTSAREAGTQAAGLLMAQVLQEGQDRETQLRHQATHDNLTGLLNERGLKETLDTYILQGSDSSFGIIAIDLKDFKVVNDTHGHAMGNLLLAGVGDTLSSTTRKENGGPGDRTGHFKKGKDSARPGGDEFVAIVDLATTRGDLSLTPDERLMAAQERITDRLQEFLQGDPHFQAVGVSAGRSVFHSGMTAEELLNQADASMYEDKRTQQELTGSYR